MSSLSIPREYLDGNVLTQAELDDALDSVETFVNVTKINDDNIQNSGITASDKLLNASISEAKLGVNSVSTAKIQDSAVTTVKILDSAVTNAKIATDAVHAAQIQTDAVVTAKILDANVTTAKLANNAVTSTKLSSDVSDDSLRAVTTDSIKDSAVTTAKINDGAVTPAKHSTNYSSGTLTASRTSTGTTRAALSAFTTTGRPVMIILYGGVMEFISGATATLKVTRYDGVSIRTTVDTILSVTSASVHYKATFGGDVGVVGGDLNYGLTLTFIDVPAAGTWTYELETVTTGTAQAGFTNVKMIAYEL